MNRELTYPDLVISKMANDIEQKKIKIIADRLKEVAGIELNIEEEAKRKVKRLTIEHNAKEEIIYFNGKRIVTFVRVEQPLNVEPHKYEIRVSYSYY